MPFPFVSRRMHEEQIDVLTQQNNYLANKVKTLEGERSELSSKVDFYIQKLIDSSRPLIETPKPDMVMQAIYAKARGDSALRSAMVSQALTDRADGMSDSDIIKRIHAGEAITSDNPLAQL